MARQAIRELKQSLHAGMAACASEEQRSHAKDASLSLLERSVRMRHRRLAVIRLHAAVSTGAAVLSIPGYTVLKGARVAALDDWLSRANATLPPTVQALTILEGPSFDTAPLLDAFGRFVAGVETQQRPQPFSAQAQSAAGSSSAAPKTAGTL
ncbi:hypothetical protein [uncultured Azohydromonas sp.]|jgi:hypothetical protein|uniref:hypothetical protein n=1 Tax=uncultured Azohydromonas sp. TaxID=487342 RepID=UPI002632DAB9|nr:hypothetical protein [uncultured Azohydromonas sp.]